ncbi:hypothetical protein [Sorangium cellulosum]|uniref:hypothetical protein n=1 Tax=Sorangium cellulosum TaxID=56 RepID=UPI000AAF07DF|nr:hypothetical protein [Sorangium cellulosum]
MRDKHPIPLPSVLHDDADARRVRALLVDELQQATDAGHMMKPCDWVMRDVWKREVIVYGNRQIGREGAEEEHEGSTMNSSR